MWYAVNELIYMTIYVLEIELVSSFSEIEILIPRRSFESYVFVRLLSNGSINHMCLSNILITWWRKRPISKLFHQGAAGAGPKVNNISAHIRKEKLNKHWGKTSRSIVFTCHVLCCGIPQFRSTCGTKII